MRGLRIACLLILSLAAVATAEAAQVERVRSPGGIEAWLVRDHSVPLLSIEFSFRGGSALDPEGREGLSDMTAALIDEGSGDLDSQAFQGRLEDLSIRLGFDAGQDTFRGRLKTLNANRDEAARLLNMALTRPRFDPEPVERIRNQILAGIRARSRDPDHIAGHIWARAVFPHHPYGRPGEGTAASVAAIATADMRGLVRDRFARDRLIVGVAGDITPAQLGPLLDTAFASLPATSKAPLGVAKAKTAAAGQTFVAEQDVPQSVAIFSQPGIARRDPDYYVAQVLNHILGGGGFTSRLYAEVREARGLAYSVHTALHPLEGAALLTGGVATANEGIAESLAVIRAEWRRLREQGVTDAELEDAQRYLTGSFPLSFTSTDSLARMLVSMQYFDLGIDFLDRRNAYIDAVTRQDIHRLARRLLDPDALTVVVVGKPKDVKATAPTPDIGG